MTPQDAIRYAENYDVSIARAIGDRDYPMNEADILMVFYECEKRMPTEQELETMHPESNSYIAKYADEMQRDYDSIYG